MERDKWTCVSCGASGDGVLLNVHHAYYEAGRKPWEYPNDMLVTYCDMCHKERHYSINQFLCFLLRQNLRVFRGIESIRLGDLTQILECLDPGMPDEICAEILSLTNRAFYLGIEKE
jgi:hypothetical protein